MSNMTRYDVVIRPGCHCMPTAPVVSTHASIWEAVQTARKSDRLCVVLADRDVCVYMPPQRGGKCGPGAYGSGPRKGEPTIRELVDAAIRIECEARGIDEYGRPQVK